MNPTLINLCTDPLIAPSTTSRRDWQLEARGCSCVFISLFVSNRCASCSVVGTASQHPCISHCTSITYENPQTNRQTYAQRIHAWPGHVSCFPVLCIGSRVRVRNKSASEQLCKTTPEYRHSFTSFHSINSIHISFTSRYQSAIHIQPLSSSNSASSHRKMFLYPVHTRLFKFTFHFGRTLFLSAWNWKSFTILADNIKPYI